MKYKHVPSNSGGKSGTCSPPDEMNYYNVM